MNKKKKRLFFLKLYPVLILSTILFMCIGYAATGGINLSITGNAFAQMKKEVYITESIYQNDINTYKNESSLKSISSTVLYSKIKLSETDSNSQITYKVTLYNNNDYDVEFDNITFDDTFYDNKNIIFEVSENLKNQTVLRSKKYTTFEITFKYKDGFTPSTTTNVLNAYININTKLIGHTVTLVYDDGITPNSQVQATTYAQLPNPTREGYGFDGWYLLESKAINSFVSTTENNPWKEEPSGTWSTPTTITDRNSSSMETEFTVNKETGILSFDIIYLNMDYNCVVNYTITNLDTNEKNTEYLNYNNMPNKAEHKLEKGNYKINFYAGTAAPETSGVILQLKNIQLTSITEQRVPDIISENITVGAKWKVVNNMITYVYNDEQGSIGVAYYDTSKETFALDVPVQEGYEFVGWYTTEDLSGTAITSLEKGTTGEITLYGKWEKKTIIGVVNISTLAVREIPSTTGTQVARLTRDTVVEIYETTVVDEMEWGRIETGWILMEYVTIQ